MKKILILIIYRQVHPQGVVRRLQLRIEIVEINRSRVQQPKVHPIANPRLRPSEVEQRQRRIRNRYGTSLLLLDSNAVVVVVVVVVCTFLFTKYTHDGPKLGPKWVKMDQKNRQRNRTLCIDIPLI